MTEFERKSLDEWIKIGPPPLSLAAPVDCELIELAGADDTTGAARLFEPKSSTGAVLYLHGIQSHSGWFLLSCDHLRKQGLTVLATDRRGSGLNFDHRGHADNPEQLITDVDLAVDWLIERTGQKQIHLVAVSWSGKLALAYAARFQHKLKSITLVGPGLKALVDISLPEKIAVGINGAIHPYKYHDIPLNDPKLFTENPAMIKYIEGDPLKLTKATAGFLVTSHRLDAMARKAVENIHIPVYLFLAECDRIINNAATIKMLLPILKSIPGSKTPAKTYPNAHHTLDFELDPKPFFEELASVLIENS